MQGKFSFDGSPAKKAPIPACAAATLLYANRIIKPGSRPVNRLASGLLRQLTLSNIAPFEGIIVLRGAGLWRRTGGS